jgi:Protein of unknown function (DUF3307)
MCRPHDSLDAQPGSDRVSRPTVPPRDGRHCRNADFDTDGHGPMANYAAMFQSIAPPVIGRSVVFVVALLALLIAHQVGDHIAQTDRQAAHKAAEGASSWRAMAGHLAGYHATAAVVLIGTFAVLELPWTVRGVGAGLAFSAVTHGFLDRRWPVQALLRATGSEMFAKATTPVAGMYAADQALHQFALLISALLVASL